jgi:serine/threonine protein kinase
MAPALLDTAERYQLPSEMSSIVPGMKIAEGGYGEVFKGTGGPPDLLVAVKRFKSPKDCDTELQNLLSIKKAKPPHNSIIIVIGPLDKYCILLPLEKESLKSQLETTCEESRSVVLRNVGELFEGISWLHKQVGYHLDIKPGNILRRRTGGYVLIDFGTLLPKGSSHNSEHNFSEYACRLDDKVGGWSDVWSIGCVTMVILVWVTQGHDEVENFRDERKSAQKHAESDGPVHINVPYFDFGSDTSPAVVQKLTELGKEFPKQVPILYQMLEHDRRNRLTMFDASLRWSGSLK